MKNYHDLIGWLRFMGKMQTSVSIYNQSADAIENLLKELHETKSELDAMRNELCCKCGNYREAHNGACDGCRWEKEE